MELKGLKIGFLGDSITEGHGVTDKENMYYRHIERDMGLSDIYVDGIGGTRIAKQKEPSDKPRHDLDFISRVDNIDADCDVVVVFGGTNDFGHGDAPFGKIGDTTPDTFCGAVATLASALIERFPTSTIVFMGPLHRTEEDDPCGSNKPSPVGTLYEYADAMRAILRRYAIPFLDMLEVGIFTPKIPKMAELYMPDGLHPNDAGQRKIADRLEGFLLSL